MKNDSLILNLSEQEKISKVRRKLKGKYNYYILLCMLVCVCVCCHILLSLHTKRLYKLVTKTQEEEQCYSTNKVISTR